MKKLLLATVATLALALALPAQAAIVDDLGVNPTSATGHFSNGNLGGLFTDQYTFQLVGSPQFITFSSATNVFAQASDFITNFSGALFQQVGAVGGGDDILLGGVVNAIPCPTAPTGCQVLGGSAVLGEGNYYLQIAGIGGGTSGYGGDLTVRGIGEVPIPGMALAVPAGLLAMGWLANRRRRKAA